ncbi:hypothetical protein [Flavobacterium sp.]|uniref:hypothetical protein n=1 Tax=Flavobacterium sp. TaxID=239 RepID=UPI002B4AC290|nr:hypothetical protein [Flavobacterium sp.]HLF51065.1 hypothetical protein [Flavobacterium sp.]
MPRYANYPTTVEDCLYLSIKKLKDWNYLTYYGTKSGNVTWSRNGQRHSSIGISITKNEFETFVILDYKSNGEPINYKVHIISKPSNLGKGEVLYFVCPNTGKHCRKLYLHSSYFLHREAFKNLMYENQILSKSTRMMYSIFDKAVLKDEVYDQLYSKHFRTHYNGKETKRYKIIMDKINISNTYPTDTFERLAMM